MLDVTCGASGCAGIVAASCSCSDLREVILTASSQGQRAQLSPVNCPSHSLMTEVGEAGSTPGLHPE